MIPRIPGTRRILIVLRMDYLPVARVVRTAPGFPASEAERVRVFPMNVRTGDPMAQKIEAGDSF